MISKLLYALENGFRALKTHSRFLLVIAFVLVFPLLLLSLILQVEAIAFENIKTAQKSVVSVVHQRVEESLSSEEVFVATANKTTAELQVKPTILLYTKTPNGFTFATATTPVTDDLVPSFMLETAPGNGELFIFESADIEVRIWTAITKGVSPLGEYALVSIYDFSRTDQLITDRRSGMYGMLAIVTLLLVLLSYWLIRQINWQHRHQKLKQKLDEQKALATTITHEFRAPLTAVSGHLSFLRESNRLRAKDLQSLEQMELSVERLRHLVNDFLEVASIQSSKLKLSISPVRVSDVVNEVLHTLGSAAAKKELAIKDGTRDNAIVLQTDHDRLVQILVNVVSNAIKYTEKGTISIVYEQNPLFVTLRIQDTGSGISAEDQKKLFRPFSRVGGVEKTTITGSGLGMWITQQLVDLLGGTIAVESIKGVGTHVVIRFELREIAKRIREGIL